MRKGKDYLIFPLDVASMEEAKRYTELLAEKIGLFKVGLELFIRCGPEIIGYIHSQTAARVFLDLKLHDIPTTVGRAMSRIADLGVVASMQPVHPPGSSGLPLEPTISIMGRDRWADTFPWAELRRVGVPLAFGTDWPTAPLSPFNAIHAALSRKPWADDLPDQRLPFAQVFAAYSAGGAHAGFAEALRGELAPGKQADLILLSGAPRELIETPDACRTALTICNGAIIHQEAP